MSAICNFLPPTARHRRAFTLMEVMIAVGIFCVAMIAILGVMTRGLGTARSLQISGPDAGMLAAELSVTNQLHDSKTENGDFGDRYPGFTWERETYLISSNGLFEVDFFVFKKTDRGPVLYDALSVWMYKPDSPRAEVSRPAFAPRGDSGFRDQ
jgi:prepilin-type N-terminal cleavage/methylation domain-containing protein